MAKCLMLVVLSQQNRLQMQNNTIYLRYRQRQTTDRDKQPLLPGWSHHFFEMFHVKVDHY